MSTLHNIWNRKKEDEWQWSIHVQILITIPFVATYIYMHMKADTMWISGQVYFIVSHGVITYANHITFLIKKTFLNLWGIKKGLPVSEEMNKWIFKRPMRFYQTSSVHVWCSWQWLQGFTRFLGIHMFPHYIRMIASV